MAIPVAEVQAVTAMGSGFELEVLLVVAVVVVSSFLQAEKKSEAVRTADKSVKAVTHKEAVCSWE